MSNGNFMEKAQPAKRNIQLDVLRGVAVILVICHHFFKPPPELESHWLSVILMQLRYFGWIGVDLFFVLSGFLVSGLIFLEFRKHNEFRAPRFLIRRGFKIYPAYYASIIASLLLIPGGFTQQTTPFIIALCIFLQNYSLDKYTLFSETLWGHMWSLSVEEHFYFLLVLSFFLILKWKKNFNGVPLLCVTVCILVLIFRHIACWGATFGSLFEFYYPLYMPTHFRIDALSFGVLLSYLHHYHHDQLKNLVLRFKWPALLLGVALTLPCSVWGLLDYFTLVFGLTMLYLGCGLILLVTYYGNWSIKFISPVVASIGFYSYSIYIWHRLAWFCTEIFTVFCPLPYFLKNLSYFCFAIIAGVIMGKLIEMPFLALREKLFPSRSVT